MKTEATIQSEILRYLKSLGALCWVIKAALCNERGVPDILCCYRGRFVAFEVKTKKGRLSGPQRVQLDRIRAARGRAAVVRSRKEVETFLTQLDGEDSDGEAPLCSTCF